MKITKELIARFFTGQCSQTEANAVLRYFDEDPEAFEKYTGKKEWDSLRSADYPLPDGRSERMFAKISAEIFQSRMQLNSWVIAASVILVMAAGSVFFKSRMGNQDKMALAKKVGEWQSVENPSEKAMDLILADGTTVHLGAHSTISYQFPFPAKKRDVRLNGQGFFKVAKDKKRPFTVYSGNVSTTVLGTAFAVDSFTDQNITSIKLYEGKVLVKRLNAINSGSDDSFYLYPSQELTYNNSSGAVAINIFDEKGSSPEVNQAKGLIARQTGVSISFDREPLENVFEEIEKVYQINLVYPKAGLKNHYFTGKFNKTDSLDRVLRVIAEMNQLEITKITSGYRINKKQKQF